MALILYNTLTRNLEEFVPLTTDRVSLYTCGPTVYNYAHIGNLRTYIFEDILKRVLGANGYRVYHVMNITDVGHLTSDADEGEDKMEKGARREGKTVYDIAEQYTKAFKANLDDLNIIHPDVYCKATEHIQEMIDLVKRLEDNGLTYATSDGIYFDTSKFPAYGNMAGLRSQELLAGARVGYSQEKKNPTDFALWKFTPPGVKRAMEWDSPWGIGFPGWHIECSAMSMEYLGEQFDIHCGGTDHIKVHHTNEIAQAQGATGKEPVRYWMHGEFLVIQKGKMSKSEENFITLQTVKDKGYDPLSYRYLCLMAHYRSPLNFTWESLDSAQAGLFRIRALYFKAFYGSQQESPIPDHPTFAGQVKSFESKLKERANNDLDMPAVLNSLFGLIEKAEILINKGKLGTRDFNAFLKALNQADEVLGLGLSKTDRFDSIIAKGIDTVFIKKRRELRKGKKWPETDRMRNEYQAKGYEIKDLPFGTEVRHIASGVVWVVKDDPQEQAEGFLPGCISI